MNPYASLSVDCEPFSNTPDPAFLASTNQHATCLQELEISLRLRRGLCVVTGDIGTGKTTLCRSLVRALSGDADIDLHLMLDPQCDSTEEFLRVLLASLTKAEQGVHSGQEQGEGNEPGLGPWQLKEAIKQQLFRLGEEQKRLVVLIIDEGQKLSPENLETLRELLNYETNACKLLQIAIFAQSELEPVLAAMPNLADRINLRRKLLPLGLGETAALIRHRVAVATAEGQPPLKLFRPLAVLAVHRISGGSPRKIVRLCHKAMLETVLRGKTRIGLREVLAARQTGDSLGFRSRLARASFGFAATCALVLALWLSLGGGGPVLQAGGQAAGVGAQSAGHNAGYNGDSSALDAGPTLRPEAGVTRALPRGVSLLPATDEGRPGAAIPGLTLAPESTGPALRGKVQGVPLGDAPASGPSLAPGAPSTLLQPSASPQSSALPQSPAPARPELVSQPDAVAKATPLATQELTPLRPQTTLSQTRP